MFPLLHADGHSIQFEHQICFKGTQPSKVIVVSRDLTQRHENERLNSILSIMDMSGDLVAYFCVQNGLARRTYSSRSHSTVLGHNPETCNGELSTLTHLLPASVLERTPHLVSAIESGALVDGTPQEMRLLHADGREMPFEWRMTMDPFDSHAFIVVFRDISDRIDKERLARAMYEQTISQKLDHCFDLVVEVMVRDGVATRTFSSASHRS